MCHGSSSHFSFSVSFQVFRTDLITAMKLPDSSQLNPDEYYVLADPWRQEWEKGVQVPVSPGTIPEPVARYILVQPVTKRKQAHPPHFVNNFLKIYTSESVVFHNLDFSQGICCL